VNGNFGKSTDKQGGRVLGAAGRPVFVITNRRESFWQVERQSARQRER
jgi:hypothetical protein